MVMDLMKKEEPIDGMTLLDIAEEFDLGCVDKSYCGKLNNFDDVLNLRAAVILYKVHNGYELVDSEYNWSMQLFDEGRYIKISEMHALGTAFSGSPGVGVDRLFELMKPNLQKDLENIASELYGKNNSISGITGCYFPMIDSNKVEKSEDVVRKRRGVMISTTITRTQDEIIQDFIEGGLVSSRPEFIRDAIDDEIERYLKDIRTKKTQDSKSKGD